MLWRTNTTGVCFWKGAYYYFAYRYPNWIVTFQDRQATSESEDTA